MTVARNSESWTCTTFHTIDATKLSKKLDRVTPASVFSRAFENIEPQNTKNAADVFIEKECVTIIKRNVKEVLPHLF